MAGQEAEEPILKGSLQRAATAILTPSRTVLAVAVGGPLLVARGVWWVLDQAADEGERQLERLGGLWSRRGSVSHD